MLPKFLIADSNQDSLGRLFVVHTEEPRFILEENEDANFAETTIHWIDEPQINDAAVEILLNEAYQFLENELVLQESMYNELVKSNTLT